MVSLDEYLSVYNISESGVVSRAGRVLKWRIYRDGYPYVRLTVKGVPRDFLVHRLVAIVHIPNPSGFPVVNHKDGNTLNPHKDNLEWCTLAHNSQHSYDELGREPSKGTQNGKSKLTEEQVRDIRILIADGVLRQWQIAERYGVDQTVIAKIKAGKLWGWLE